MKKRLVYGMRGAVALVGLLCITSCFVFFKTNSTLETVKADSRQTIESQSKDKSAKSKARSLKGKLPHLISRKKALQEKEGTSADNAIVAQTSVENENAVAATRTSESANVFSSFTTASGNGQGVVSARYPKMKHLAYREKILPETEKGKGESLLREWLVKPSDEGYTHHLEETYKPDENGELQLVGTREYVADQVVAIVNKEEGVEAFRKRIEGKGFVLCRELMEDEKGNTMVVVKTPELSLDSAETLRTVLSELQMCSSIDYDEVVTINATPNDSYYSRLWGMTKIKAPQAWGVRTDASAITVAVLDTGINYNHQDLSGNMWRNPSETSGNGRDDDGNGITDDVYGVRYVGGVVSGNPLDDNGHGSHCAGTIGAVGNNSSGVAGVAWRAKLMALKFLSSSGSGATSDAVSCMSYARAKGAKIVSCSFGGGSYNSSMYSAINSLRSSGIIVVCAAGNDGTNNDISPHYPSSYSHDNIVAVAATTSSDALASFSCYGTSSVDIAAPGYDIYSTLHSSSSAYGSKNGTSMATPHVSGALALIWANYPSESYSAIISRLYSAADTVSSLSGKVKNAKRLNVGAALTSTTIPAPTGLSASKGTYSGYVYLSWNAVSGASYYRVYRATSSSGTKTAISSWQTSRTFSDSTASVGITYYYYVQAASSSSGANASSYSSYATGYRAANLTDVWDPGDNTASGATTITPSTTVQTHGTHKLSGSDQYDWFKISMTAGRTYTFEATSSSTGTYDTYGELYNSTSATTANRVAYNDDKNGSNDRNFKITYKPTISGTYYLRVRHWSVGRVGEYILRYSYVSPGDDWDTGDDTSNGATVLIPTTTSRTHGPHTLSSTDSYDYFRIQMTAGMTYVFESTGSTDKVGELYDLTKAGSDGRIAYDDDGGSGLNFRLVYTPTRSNTYYLRVRAYSVGNAASYSLNYYYIEPQAEIDVEYFRPQSGTQTWGDSLFLNSTTNGLTPQYRFTTSDKIYINYALHNRFEGDIPGAMTNVIFIIDNSVSSDDPNWILGDYEAVTRDLPAGYYAFRNDGDLWMKGDVLGAGSYTLVSILNSDAWLNPSVEESDENWEDNYREIVFSVVEPTKTLSRIEVSGNASIPSEGTAYYTCTAFYSDDTQASVQPEWSLSSTSYASIYQDGRVMTRSPSANQTVTITATFGGKTATKQVTLLASGNEGASDPFRDIVQYPTVPMTIVGEVKIDGVLAAAGDVVAGFVGEEVRGKATVDGNGRVLLTVSLIQGGETLIFKIWDASAGDEGSVYSASQRLTGVLGGRQGTVDEPFLISANARDPFGLPSNYPNVPMIVYARVQIDGIDAAAGDMLAAFVGDELRGKESIALDNGKAICLLPVNVNRDGETVTFKIWDAANDKLLTVAEQMSAVSGTTVGTIPTIPYLLTASSTANTGTLELSLRSVGWRFVSFNVLPEDTTPETVFASVNSSIEQVIGCDASDNVNTKVYIPNVSQSTLKNLARGNGYWVKVKTGGSTLSVSGTYDRERVISLREGWNQCGYTLSDVGTLSDVMATTLSSGAIDQIVSGVDPETGSTHVYMREFTGSDNWQMKPGMGYWIYANRSCQFTFDIPTGSQTAQALSVISDDTGARTPFCEYNEAGEAILAPIENPSFPTVVRLTPITVFGKVPSVGDWIAFYLGESETPFLLQDVQAGHFDGDSLAIPMGFQVGVGSEIRMRIWNHHSGLKNPEIFEADATFILANGSLTEALVVTGTPPTYTVTFDLDGKATRTGGGELVQTISYGEDVIMPVIQANAGYQFLAWDMGITDIRKDTTVKASFAEIVIPMPSAPTGVTASDGTHADKVALTWNAVDGATSYIVCRGTEDDSSSAVELARDVTGVAYDDTTAVPGTTYYYWVKAVNASGESTFSASAPGKINLPVPSAPSGVTASDGTHTDKVTLTWNTVEGATSYIVYRGTEDDSSSAVELARDVTGAAYDDTTAVPGTTYHYWVKAVNASGESAFSASATGKINLPVPFAPTGVTASNGTHTDKVALAWNDVEGVTSYIVYRGTEDDSSLAVELARNVTGVAYDDTTAVPGTTYHYWVKAVNASGESAFSASAPGKINLPVPSAPTGVTASDGTHADKVALTWNAVDGATSYIVYRGTEDDSSSAVELACDVTGVAYDDTTAVPGTTYYYWVKAVNASGAGAFSASALGKINLPVLSAPSGVAASNGTHTDKVTLAWEAVEGATTYIVYRGTEDDSSLADELARDITGTTYDDATAIPGMTYYYWVRAVNASGPGAFSASVVGMMYLPPPSAPSGVTASFGTHTDKVALTWDAVDGATSYIVYRGTEDDASLAVELACDIIGTTYNDTSAVPGTTYHYWVKAVNLGGASDFSTSATGKILGIDDIWRYEERDGAITILGMINAPTGDVEIPAVINGCPVTNIDPDAFKDYGNLASVTIPSGVETIGANAFANCSGLDRIVFFGRPPQLASGVFAGIANPCNGYYAGTFRAEWEAVIAADGTWNGLVMQALSTVDAQLKWRYYDGTGTYFGQLVVMTTGDALKMVDEMFFAFEDRITNATEGVVATLWDSANKAAVARTIPATDNSATIFRAVELTGMVAAFNTGEAVVTNGVKDLSVDVIPQDERTIELFSRRRVNPWSSAPMYGASLVCVEGTTTNYYPLVPNDGTLAAADMRLLRTSTTVPVSARCLNTALALQVPADPALEGAVRIERFTVTDKTLAGSFSVAAVTSRGRQVVTQLGANAKVFVYGSPSLTEPMTRVQELTSADWMVSGETIAFEIAKPEGMRFFQIYLDVGTVVE